MLQFNFQINLLANKSQGLVIAGVVSSCPVGFALRHSSAVTASENKVNMAVNFPSGLHGDISVSEIL